MSKKYQTAQKEKRAAKKRSEKTAMKAQYAAWRDAGTNGKRARIRAKKGVARARWQTRRPQVTARLESGLTRRQTRNQVSLAIFLRGVR